MIQIHKTPKILRKIYPDLTWEKESADSIFLTFDDGPDPEATVWVLDELKKAKAKATFFCVGENINKYQEVSNRIISEGHKIGNHTHNHLKGWETSTEKYIENVSICQEQINRLQSTGKRLFRAPYGRITRKQIESLKYDFEIVMWSHLSWDFDKNLNIEKSLRRLKKAKPGSILVFHDSQKSFQNVKLLLPELLIFFAAKNFKFRTL